jgi:hypothetical protein
VSARDLISPATSDRRRAQVGDAAFAYLAYYLADQANDEIVILGVKHPAQKREHTDR